MVESKDFAEWLETIQEYIEWNLSLIERNQKMRERGSAIFVHDTPISIMSLQMRIEDFKKIPTPNVEECKRVRKNLEESMKLRKKGLEQETKYYEDIQKQTLAGRFGRGSVAFNISMSDDLLNKAIEDVSKLTHSN